MCIILWLDLYWYNNSVGVGYIIIRILCTDFSVHTFRNLVSAVNMATAIAPEKCSEQYKDAKCSICAKDNKEEIADHYCYDCSKHMCTSCLGYHNKFYENHNVVQGLGDSKDVLTEKCGKHAEELITLYCRQHEELMCGKCRHLDHRKCQDLQNIMESSDELNADPDLQAVPAQLKSALDNINKAIEALDKHMTNIQQSGNGFLTDLEDYAKKLLAQIEKLKVKGKKDIKRKQKELLAATKHHRQSCVLTKDEINQCLEKITKSKERKATTFVLKKKGQTIAQKADALFTESDSLIKGHQFIFMTEMRIFDSLNCFHFLVKDVTKVSEKKQINVRIKGDKSKCDNNGCCHLSDGSLVVADYGNSRLKLVDPSSSMVTKFCDTDGQPTAVCCIGPQEVAVTFSSTKVQVYNTESLTRTRTVELAHKTFWIACHDGLLYCAGLFGTIVYVHDVSSGRKLMEISKNTDGRQLFSNIKHIAVNSSGDRLYVTDRDRGLVCVGVGGRRIFHLSEKNLGLTGAYGVTTDHRGHVYVCGLYSHNVVMVTEDGHVVGQILSKEDGITWRPRCLSYNESRSQLCVGGLDSDQLLMVEW